MKTFTRDIIRKLTQTHILECNMYIAILITLTSVANPAFALRPFDSTDADVIDAKEIELEIGIISVEHDAGDTSYILPGLVFNYGLSNSLELVAEFELEKTAGKEWELVEPAIFLKSMLKEGVLQGKPGLSFATEFGLLLPSSLKTRKHLGAEAIIIASGEIADMTYHLNIGGGINLDGDSFGLWGLIGEMPLSGRVTLAVEVTGEDTNNHNSEQSALVGLLFNPSGAEIEWDVGLRRGISNAATDYSLTFGFTFAY